MTNQIPLLDRWAQDDVEGGFLLRPHKKIILTEVEIEKILNDTPDELEAKIDELLSDE